MIKKYITKRIIKYCKNNFKQIPENELFTDVCYFNQSCHWNSYQDMLTRNSDQIAVLCIRNDNKKVIVHYINKEGDYYYDITLGVSGYINYKYYYIGKCIHTEEDSDMDFRLYDLKEFILRTSIGDFKSKIIQKIKNIDNIL